VEDLSGAEEANRHHPSTLTVRTAEDVPAGEALQGVFRLLGLRRLGRRLPEQLACAGELGAVAVGVESVVADPDETLGQDVEQEALDELAGLELHGGLPLASSAAPVAEADASVPVIDEPVVGESDAVGVAGEVVEHLRRPGHGGLAVDDPVVASQASASCRRELGVGDEPLLSGTREPVETLASEDLGEGPHGKEISLARRPPGGTVGRERTAGDEAVEVNVSGKGLAPGVEDGGDAEVSSEVLGILAEGLEGLGSAAKEEIVEEARMAPGERVELVREREDHVEVVHGQEPGPLQLEPTFLG
jgi:hypothetical protein